MSESTPLISSEPQDTTEPTTTKSSHPVTEKPQKEKQSKPTSNKPKPKPRKVLDPLLDAWYYNEVNKRDAREPSVFKNYQINPYTKKTLEFVTPKITERKRVIPKQTVCGSDPCFCEKTGEKPLTEDDVKLLESYHMVKEAIEKSVISTPMKKYCEPQTEMMRLGWFPKLAPPPPPRTCLYMRMNGGSPCCYYYPTPPEEQISAHAEAYDERFRAVHTTAEFIKTQERLRQFDAVMNPNGTRGQIKVAKPRPSGEAKKK